MNGVFGDDITNSCEPAPVEDSECLFVGMGSEGRVPVTVPPLSGRLMTLISSTSGA